MEANIGHLPTKFGYKQTQGWKVINRYRVLQVNLHIWPNLTLDLLMWPLSPEYHGGQYRASTNQVWLQTDARLESYSSFCKRHGRTDGGRRTDGRTQFGSLGLPSTSVGSTKIEYSMCNGNTHIARAQVWQGVKLSELNNFANYYFVDSQPDHYIVYPHLIEINNPIGELWQGWVKITPSLEKNLPSNVLNC